MNVDASFWDFVLNYHISEPILANICVLAVVFTPIIALSLYHLRAKEKMQLQNKVNIKKLEKKEKERVKK